MNRVFLKMIKSLENSKAAMKGNAVGFSNSKIEVPDIKVTEITDDLVWCILALNKILPGKEAVWLNTENPHFGYIRPVTLFALGRGHKVKAFIKNAQEGNFP